PCYAPDRALHSFPTRPSSDLIGSGFFRGRGAVTNDKKYQVFVSSTYADLQDARQELMLALLSMGMIPTGMELYPTETNNQWSMRSEEHTSELQSRENLVCALL